MATVAAGTGHGRGRVELELRQAIEPWHVLGEEATAGGTARYVDSSVERLQVSVRGIDPQRHLVTCQGVPVPLTATPTGDHYAGVRYRAWQPWSALHPSIEVQAPLTFDVVDTVSQVSLGGATYHVVHPGGRSYDHPPVNANEAEARRASRFEAHGHTAGTVDVGALREQARPRSQRRVPPHPRPAPREARPTTVTVLRDYAAGVTQPTLGDALGSASAGGRYDEVVGPDGALRTPWKGLAELAVGLTDADLHRVDDDIVRALSDDGVTYARPGQRSQPWRLDPMPLVIDAASWAPLEIGLAQRAELLNALLADLYGKQRVLSEGVLPAADRARSPGLRPRRRAALDPRPAPPRAGRHRPRSRPPRGVAGAGRPHPGAVGARLRDGEPSSHLAGAARALPRGRAAPHGAVLQRAALGPAAVGQRRPRRPARRRPVARQPVRDRLRPGLPRLRAGLPARAGQRPRRARGLGADARLRPARARRRHPASRRRRLERPARAAR